MTMPAKRRQAKGRLLYSDTIERLLAGEPIEWTQQADSELIGVEYFDDPPGMPPEAVQRASDIVGKWRALEIELREKGVWHGIPVGPADAY
jgi:hypothetical protein